MGGDKQTMSGKATGTKHMGTKFLGFFFGLVLAVIYTVKEFFAPTFVIITAMPNILFAWAMFLIVIPLIVFFAELLWRFVHAYSEKFPVE